MPETDSMDSGLRYMLRSECLLHQRNITEKIDHNTEQVEKVIKILQGNGHGGLIWKVNLLMLRNQWVDKVIGIFLSILSTLITLYLSGVLKL